ncbi:MAG: S8 family serine peptidase [Cyanobacteria bacterium J06592_8]
MVFLSEYTVLGDSGANQLLGTIEQDEIFGLEGADRIWASESIDSLYGNVGADSIYGHQDEDIIYGGLDSDLLFGGQGNDVIYGDEDEDTIYGDRGADTLIGGAEADVFVIGSGTGGNDFSDADFIIDFTGVEDSFELIGNLEFEDLALTTTSDNDAAIEIEATGEVLAVLRGVDVDTLSRANFLPIVPEINDDEPLESPIDVDINELFPPGTIPDPIPNPNPISSPITPTPNLQPNPGNNPPDDGGATADDDFVIDMSEVPGFDLLDEPLEVEPGVFFLGTGLSPEELRLVSPFNLEAADTTNADQLWSGGGLGLDLTGDGVIVGVWDGGSVRSTHQEFDNRVTPGETERPPLDNHATHVAGTIGAAGVNPEARGIANQVEIVSFDFVNDQVEIDNNAGQFPLSNHSYGSRTGWSFGLDWSSIGIFGSVATWMGDRSLSSIESQLFGVYDSDTQALDQTLATESNLLSVWAAGNDRDEKFVNLQGDNSYVTYLSAHPNGPGWYQISNNVLSAPPSDGDGGTGFDSLSLGGGQTAKNTLVVGAIQDITADPYDASDVRISDFSSFGPTDDGRIKPDVVGNGFDVLSAWSSSNDAYESIRGTSMAAPNVTGTAALLYEHYNNLFGEFPNSATGKALLIHTANDAGNPGPDYIFGWGVVDGAQAANFLTNVADGETENLQFQETYSGSERTFEVFVEEGDNLKATIVWTDPVGTPQSGELDDRTSVLVNDLDLWITDENGTIYNPWTLDPENPSANAQQDERNIVDNVEQVLFEVPAAGTYTVHVGHRGTQPPSTEQPFSLLVSTDASAIPEPPVDPPIDPPQPPVTPPNPPSPGTPITDPVTGVTTFEDLDGASKVVVSPDDRHIYVAGSSSISIFSWDAATDQATLVGTQDLSETDLSIITDIEIDPVNGDQLYVNDGIGLDGGIAVYDRDSNTGELSLVEVEATSGTGSGILVSPDGQNLYRAAFLEIEIFDIDSTTGELTESGQLSGGLTSGPNISEFIASPNGGAIYATEATFNDQVVKTFSRDPETGDLSGGRFGISLRDDGDLFGASLIGGLAVTPDGDYLFVPVFGFSTEIAIFELGEGRLDSPADFSFADRTDIEVSPDGEFVYVHGFDELVELNWDESTEQLSFSEEVPLTITGIADIAVSPSGDVFAVGDSSLAIIPRD